MRASIKYDPVYDKSFSFPRMSFNDEQEYTRIASGWMNVSLRTAVGSATIIKKHLKRYIDLIPPTPARQRLEGDIAELSGLNPDQYMNKFLDWI